MNTSLRFSLPSSIIAKILIATSKIIIQVIRCIVLKKQLLIIVLSAAHSDARNVARDKSGRVNLLA